MARNTSRVPAASALSTAGTAGRPATDTTAATTAGPITPPTSAPVSAHDVACRCPGKAAPTQASPTGKTGAAASPMRRAGTTRLTGTIRSRPTVIAAQKPDVTPAANDVR